MLYNFLSAFVACLLIILVGEWLAKFTKGWVPSVFISAVITLICFWTFLPKNVVADARLLQIGSSLAIFLLITHLGTLFSLKRLRSSGRPFWCAWPGSLACAWPAGSSARSSWIRTW